MLNEQPPQAQASAPTPPPPKSALRALAPAQHSPSDHLQLWAAQGLGIGRIPWAPGTFGSLLGLGWFALLLASGNWFFYLGGTFLGVAASVWLCGRAEQILGITDPGSVVIDEIIALPVCFLGWLVLLSGPGGPLPPLQHFFSPTGLPATFGVFVAFRFFDIAKPWPVRQSQELPGGWGVTVDDVLAGIYVNAVVLLWILIARMTG